MTKEERSDLVKHRQERAQNTLNEVVSLVELGYYNNAVNRLYYACYYAVSALLINSEIQSKTHMGTKQMFGLHFIKPGLISKISGDYYTLIFEQRQTGDCEDYIVFFKEEVTALIQPAQILIAEIATFLDLA